jgi:hypothetical protein
MKFYYQISGTDIVEKNGIYYQVITAFNWPEFIRYCNTPCYLYEVEEPDEHTLL